MFLQIYSIHDSGAAAHLPPFFMAKDTLAIRIFSDCINDEKHSFAQHPGDYTLFRHGQFDCDTGEFIIEMMESLGNGVAFRKPTRKMEFPELAEVTDVEPQVIRK